MKKSILILLFLSGCATKHIVTLDANKFIAVANDSTGLVTVEDSIQNAQKLAQERCGSKTVIVDSMTSREDHNGLPETSLTFHCK
ncbi:MAG: hypothetical protein ACK41T_01115 [Pseudobdellovibrio sp.]